MLNKALFSQGDVVAVALSGGKDSVCLLHLMLANAKDLGVTVKAVNVEHGIRGESSINDSLFVESLCKALNVPLKSKRFDCVVFSKQNGLTVEEGARKLRYDFFFELLESGFCNKIATAHHLSDSVETVLLNLFRGASPSGLKGIPEVSYNGKIIRPMLTCTREQIDEYVVNNSLNYVEDETNGLTDYSRNFLRLKVIPEIKSRFPEMEKSILRFTTVLANEDEFLSRLAGQIVEIFDDSIKIKCDVENVIFARACVIAMKGIGIVKDYDKAHIDALISLKDAQNGKKISLLNGVVAVKEYSHVALYKSCSNPLIETSFVLGDVEFLGQKITVSKVEETPNFKNSEDGVLYFDLDKIPQSAVIRNRRDCDVFTKFGGGTKNLGDYMTDKKIPLIKRDRVPIVADGNVVFIVGNYEISDLIKIDAYTKNIGKIIIR